MKAWMNCVVALVTALGVVSEVKAVEAESAAQPPTAVTSKTKYDAVFSVCGPMHSADQAPVNIERDNAISPLQVISSYFESRGVLLNLVTGRGEPESVQVKVLKGPAHGKLVPADSTSFMYYADQGYLGSDQVTYEVVVLGKKFKVIQTVVIHNSGNLDYPTDAAKKTFDKVCPSKPRQ